VVDYARGHKINPELALRDAANRRAETTEERGRRKEER
jgi:hypothetical protein